MRKLDLRREEIRGGGLGESPFIDELAPPEAIIDPGSTVLLVAGHIDFSEDHRGIVPCLELGTDQRMEVGPDPDFVTR